MKMTAGAGSGVGRMQNSKITGKMMKTKKMKKIPKKIKNATEVAGLLR